MSILMLFGCATKIPGGDRSYSIQANHSEALRRMDARYDYGPFTNRILGANSGIGSFTEYHTFIARWNGEDGERKEHCVAIGPLIEELKQREGGWFPTGWSTLVFRFEAPFLRIALDVGSRDPIEFYSYPLYQFEMR